MQKNLVLLKAVSMYLIYFLYTYYASYLVQIFEPVNSSIVMFVFDFAFIILISCVYLKELKNDWKNIKEKYKLKRTVKSVICGVVSLFVLNIVMGVISTILFPNSSSYSDQNTLAIQGLASLSLAYTLFKTMIFSVIAEELLFRETLSEYIDSNVAFIFVTAIIYTAMNLIFTTTEGGAYFLVELAIYFIPALLFSYIYVKNDRNILLIMLIKFVYNLIPLTILLLGV